MKTEMNLYQYTDLIIMINRFVNPLLSVASYKSTYAENIIPIPQLSDWPKVIVNLQA